MMRKPINRLAGFEYRLITKRTASISFLMNLTKKYVATQQVDWNEETIDKK